MSRQCFNNIYNVNVEEYIADLVVNYGISNTIVLEIP